MERGELGLIGCGTVGTGVAVEFALHGWQVTVCTASPAGAQKAAERVRLAARRLVEHGLAGLSEVDEVGARVRFVDTIRQAVAGRSLIVEAVPEDLVLKQEVIAAADAMADPGVVIASATTALPVTELAARCAHPERVIGTRYTHPAHLIPVVDVVPGALTSDETVHTVRRVLTALGKRPVLFEKNSPSVVGPRLLIALMDEAFRLVDEGAADPEMIDAVFTSGLGRRFGATGVFDRADIAGLDAVASVFQRRYGNVPRVLADKVSAGHLGRKTGTGFYHWTSHDAELFDHRETRHLAAQLRLERDGAEPHSTATVVLEHGVLEEFVERAREEYLVCTPQAPPRCFAVLLGQVEGDVLVVRDARFARTVREDHPAAAREWHDVIVPCFGAAYGNERRGFWVDPADLITIARDAERQDLDVLGSVHLHPDWHRIGPPEERGTRISERPTPMDAHLFANTGWPLNLICYVEQVGDELGHTFAAWGPPPAADPSVRACRPLSVRYAVVCPEFS